MGNSSGPSSQAKAWPGWVYGCWSYSPHPRQPAALGDTLRPLPRQADPGLRTSEAHHKSRAHPGPSSRILKEFETDLWILTGVGCREGLPLRGPHTGRPAPIQASVCPSVTVCPRACLAPSRLGVCQVGAILPSSCPRAPQHSARLPVLHSNSQVQIHSGRAHGVESPLHLSTALCPPEPTPTPVPSGLGASEISRTALSPGHREQRMGSVRMGSQVSI